MRKQVTHIILLSGFPCPSRFPVRVLVFMRSILLLSMLRTELHISC